VVSGMMSVLLAGKRVGDFSGGPPIYDPTTTRANPAFNPALPITASNPQFLRTQFPNNQIPADRINPVALQVLQNYVVMPNLDGATNNYSDNRVQRFNNDAFNVRLDHSWQNGTTLFGRYSLSSEAGFTPENLP